MKTNFPRPIGAVLFSIAAVTLTVACSSQPSQLYVLSSAVAPSSQVAAADAGTVLAATDPSSNRRRVRTAIVGVSVTVPEYLDRLDIVVRTSGNELKPIYSAQWGEDLSVTATRAFTEDLSAQLPRAEVVMLPSRVHNDLDFQVNLNLTAFESDSAGVSTLTGRWTITDSAGAERASGRISRTENAKPGDYAAMARAMSHNLAGASTEIAAALARLEPPSAKVSRAGR